MTFKMNYCLLISISCILLSNYVNCAEFVPVYMWTTETKISNHVPALHKISSDSFKEVIMDYLKTNPFVVVFTEQTLSPEDFAQRDQNGNTIFPNLANSRDNSVVSYLPYVQNPIKSLKHLNKNFIEIDINNFDDIDIPNDTILIINLNDAEDNEDRTDMLKRHDYKIVSIFGEISKKYQDVLAIYTAHHTSWVASEDFSNNRQARSLLETRANDPTATVGYYDNTYPVFYSSDIRVNNISETFKVTSNKSGDSFSIVGAGTITFELGFFATLSGYWKLSSIKIDSDNIAVPKDFSAPYPFSYHCTNQTFKGTKHTIQLNDFQVQPYFEKRGNQTRFGDAYDCVGFTSVPIWSGLFITFILLFILTAGITMMIDIKTMDRFDDPKGKTITINASE